jgi:hypothetical protein
MILQRIQPLIEDQSIKLVSVNIAAALNKYGTHDAHRSWFSTSIKDWSSVS